MTEDAVLERPAPAPIPVLSPALHCVAMTAFVYLRSSFGFTFLRPKSIFFAFSWPIIFGFIIAWNEPGVWPQYRALCIFGIGAVLLYWIHFAIAFFREWNRNAAEDHYPGTSHIQWLVNRFGLPAIPGEILRLWVEPALLVTAFFISRFAFAENRLSSWMLFTAACMVAREAVNHWTTIRRNKAFTEGIEKAKRQGESLTPTSHNSEDPPKRTRTEAVKQPRNTAAADDKARERRFAEILRLRPPYMLEKAEENFLTLIKLEHPDVSGQPSECAGRAAELNEAIDFFRNLLR
jgi:hypothetical protein